MVVVDLDIHPAANAVVVVVVVIVVVVEGRTEKNSAIIFSNHRQLRNKCSAMHEMLNKVLRTTERSTR